MSVALQTAPVSFQNRRGQTLRGVLHGSPGPNMAVLCHGMLSNKDGPKQVALAEQLAERNVAALRFDFAGRGESDGTLMELSYSHRMQDCDAAIEFLCGQGARRFGVFGSSMGGAVALLTAARDERVVAVATLAAVGYPAALLENYYTDALHQLTDQGFYELPEGRIGRLFWDDSRAHDVVAAVSVLRAPILVVHGDCDTVVPCSDAHDIATAARSASLDLVAGADHHFSEPTHLRPALRRIAQFLADGLR